MKRHLLQGVLITVAIVAVGFILYERQPGLQKPAQIKAGFDALIAERSAANADTRAHNVELEKQIVEDEREGYGKATPQELRQDILDFEWARTNLVSPDSQAARDLTRDIGWCQCHLKTATLKKPYQFPIQPVVVVPAQN